MPCIANWLLAKPGYTFCCVGKCQLSGCPVEAWKRLALVEQVMPDTKHCSSCDEKKGIRIHCNSYKTLSSERMQADVVVKNMFPCSDMKRNEIVRLRMSPSDLQCTLG